MEGRRGVEREGRRGVGRKERGGGGWVGKRGEEGGG